MTPEFHRSRQTMPCEAAFPGHIVCAAVPSDLVYLLKHVILPWLASRLPR
jgi:hypothetical protein